MKSEHQRYRCVISNMPLLSRFNPLMSGVEKSHAMKQKRKAHHKSMRLWST